MPLETALLPLNDGTQICAPADITLMSNFVLKEQGDWFEDEIHFVRQFIQPGMQALDIGANYGLYSMAIANNLGDKGKLWCFEPTPDTASALRTTIKANGFDDAIELIEAGLSDHSGEASFYASPNAELNSLHAKKSLSEADKITISLQTLDDCLEAHDWQQIDFIKLDAEGEEINILKGATKTLTQLSPLIMFELKHGDHVNQPLITAFTQMGYQIYQLIPGLGVLAPFDASQPIDTYLLNLFACKSDTAEALLARELLVTKAESGSTTQASNPLDLASLALDASSPEDYQETLSAYLLSRDETLPKQIRFQHLFFAFEKITHALKQGTSRFEHLCTYGRIAFDVGQRQVGLKICDYMVQRFIIKQNPITLEQAFVPVSMEFESVKADSLSTDWAKAMIMDQLIRKHAFSCYFTKGATLPMFNILEKTGYMLPDMARRYDTLKQLDAANQSTST